MLKNRLTSLFLFMILCSIVIKQIQCASMKKSNSVTSESLPIDPKMDDSDSDDDNDNVQDMKISKIKQQTSQSNQNRHRILEQLSE